MHSEAGVMPSERLLTEITAFNEELADAGIMPTDVEIRPIGEASDFGDAYTPELQEREARIRAKNGVTCDNDKIGGRDGLRDTSRGGRGVAD